ARPLLAQVGNDRFVEFGRYDQGLQVEDEFGDILLDSRHGAELVEDSVDPDGRDGGTGDRGQQGSAKRVAEGVAEPGLERFDGEPGAVIGDDFFRERWALCNEHVGFLSANIRYMTFALHVMAVGP